MKLKHYIISLSFMVLTMPAFAGWQYNVYYVDDGFYDDDGS